MPQQKKFIRCDEEIACVLPEEFQLMIARTGTTILMSIINGSTPGMIVYSVPKGDSTKDVFVDAFATVEEALQAAQYACIKDPEELKRIISRYNQLKEQGELE